MNGRSSSSSSSLSSSSRSTSTQVNFKRTSQEENNVTLYNLIVVFRAALLRLPAMVASEYVIR